MPTPFSFPLLPEAPPAPGGGGSTPGGSAVGTSASRSLVRRAFLGNGVLRPFRRDQKGDFAHGSDEALVRSCVGQVLGTVASTEDGLVQGELPWRPEFGSILFRLKHRNNDAVLEALGRVYVADALARWEPRVSLREVGFTRASTKVANDTLIIGLLYDIIAANVPGNMVIVPDVTQDVRV